LATALRFDIYGRFVVEVVRSGGRWSVHQRTPEGKRVSVRVRIPADTSPAELPDLLDAHFRELTSPGTFVRRLD
jgi:hypothetical protein